MTKYKLAKDGRLLLDKVASLDETTKIAEDIFDSITDSIETLFKKDKYAIMLLYLWMATATGRNLYETMERYSVLKEFDDSRNPLAMTSFEYTISLRENGNLNPVDPSRFQEFQMETAKFLQDIIENLNKKER